MNWNEINRIIQDTRPYPEQAGKGELLRLVTQIRTATAQIERQLAYEALNTQIAQMLAQKHYLAFSVALSMVPDTESYRILWQALNQSLQAHTDDDRQWLAWPIILVVGSEHGGILPVEVPIKAIQTTLQEHTSFQVASELTWLPEVIASDRLGEITPDRWYQATHHTPEADLKTVLPELYTGKPYRLEAGQYVLALHAISYGSVKTTILDNQSLGKVALPLMQVWQEAFKNKDMTIFVNPLSPRTPSGALAEASKVRKYMDYDLFTANTIRQIRLKNHEVAVVIGSCVGGGIVFSFQVAHASLGEYLYYHYPLAPDEEIAEVLDHCLGLLNECHVHHVCLSPNIVEKPEYLPAYQVAIQDGLNPFSL